VVLRIPARLPRLRLRDSHPVSLAFPEPFGSAQQSSRRSFNPASRSWRFGLFHFRSPLLAESSLFLRVVRCFTSPGSPALRRDGLFTHRVSPFGYRRLMTCTRLPGAFRSVPRPSSAFVAQASPVRLLSLLPSCGEHALFAPRPLGAGVVSHSSLVICFLLSTNH
jgi:hypothetical protein